jgi:hypothetical protein
MQVGTLNCCSQEELAQTGVHLLAPFTLSIIDEGLRINVEPQRIAGRAAMFGSRLVAPNDDALQLVRKARVSASSPGNLKPVILGLSLITAAGLSPALSSGRCGCRVGRRCLLFQCLPLAPSFADNDRKRSHVSLVLS